MTAPVNATQFAPSALTVIPGTRHAWLAYVLGSMADFVKDDLGEYVAFSSPDEARMSALTAEIAFIEWQQRRLEGLSK